MPQRFLRPDIRTSQRWNETSFGAQSLYIGLMTLVDDFGRYDGRAKLIHGEVFILRDDVKPQQTAAWLLELDKRDLIQIYEIAGKVYLQVSRWRERVRSENSRFPDPPLRNAAECQQPAAESCLLSHKSSPLAISHKPSPIALRYPADAGDEFSVVFLRWIDFRKGLGKKPKDWHCLFQEQLDWLSKQPRAQRLEIVSQSIRNGWQGLFPLKQGKNGATIDHPKKIDPSKIDLPERFKSWASEKYPMKREDVMAWHTWADVPSSLRQEWWRQEKAKLPIEI